MMVLLEKNDENFNIKM